MQSNLYCIRYRARDKQLESYSGVGIFYGWKNTKKTHFVLKNCTNSQRKHFGNLQGIGSHSEKLVYSELQNFLVKDWWAESFEENADKRKILNNSWVKEANLDNHESLKRREVKDTETNGAK